LALDLFKLLDEAAASNDVRVLKEVVYFSRAVYTLVPLPDGIPKKADGGMTLLLLDSIMCH
jgi:hypothetical protein